MLKLSADDKKRIEKQTNAFNATKAELEALIKESNEKIAAKVAELEEKKLDLHGTFDDLAREAQEYHDGRSEAWQEGERGAAYSSWIENLEGVRDTLDQSIEVAEIEDLDVDFVQEGLDDVQSEPQD